MKKLVFFICVAVWSTFCQAEWPERTIKLIIPYSPGGTTDIIVRAIEPQLSELLKAPIVIEYAPGASSSIGAAKASLAHDNHTFLVTADELVANSIINPDGPHALKNFKPVAFLAHSPIMISTGVNGSRDAKTILANNNLSYGNGGVNSISNLAARKTNPKWTSISYKGGSLMFADVIPGTVNLAACSVLQATTYIQSGKLVPVMVYSRTRSLAYPNVPTSYELGVPLEASVWIGVVASRPTTDEAVDKMSKAIQTVLKNSSITQPLVDRGLTIEPMDPRSFAVFLQQNAKQIKSLL